MNKKKVICLFLGIFTSLSIIFCSCKENNNELKPSDIKDHEDVPVIIEGMKYYPISYDYVDPLLMQETKFLFKGDVSKKGAEIVLTPSKDFIKNTYVTQVVFNKDTTIYGIPPFGNEENITIDGIWGKVYYTPSPYSIHLQINKNESNSPRLMLFRIGEISKYTLIILNQM